VSGLFVARVGRRAGRARRPRRWCEDDLCASVRRCSSSLWSLRERPRTVCWLWVSCVRET